MKELFNITPHITGEGFRMQLSTGVIDVPDDNGGYIISSGCGSGKTESNKEPARPEIQLGGFCTVSIPVTNWARCMTGFWLTW